MPYYSFLLLCYNQWGMTKQAVTTLIQSLVKEEHHKKGIELIVVDNGSTDETATGIHQLIAGFAHRAIQLHYHRLEENMGPIIGMNIGLTLCRGEIIAYLNNDLIFPRGWFDKIADVLENDKATGAAVPYLLTEIELLAAGKQTSLQEIIDLTENWMSGHKDKVVYTRGASSSCLVMKREVLDKIGGNDYWFGLGQFDDNDWCIRLGIAGYKLALVGGSSVYHFVSGTLKQQPRQLTAAGNNLKKFFVKWDLKSTSNPHGVFSTVIELIKSSAYVREKHFFPTKHSEYLLSPALYNWQDDKKKLLVVADWTNENSNWLGKISSLLDSPLTTKEFCLWIPKQYFRLDNIDSIRTLPFVNVLDDDIAPANLLRLLQSFDAVVSVENDYVNRYITYVAKQQAIPIV